MVKHNNSISNGHFKKHWQKFVKTDFNKSSKKTKRRTYRISKITNLKRFSFTPTNILKPIVQNSTKMYNLKVKLGRGFSINEIRESKVSKNLAQSVGISIDKRRRENNSRKNLNIQRLNKFLEKMDKIPLEKNPKKIPMPEEFYSYIFSEEKKKKKFPGNDIYTKTSLKALENLRNIE